jgi:hypothetical protein
VAQKAYIRRYKSLVENLKGRKPGSFVNFGQFTCFWIRIQESHINGDPDRTGSGSTTLGKIYYTSTS